MFTNGKPSIVALIPARSGSKRVVDKNIRHLAGHPLLAYTVSAAKDASIFDRVIVSTDSDLYASVAAHYGAETPFLRPPSLAGDKSPDFDWVSHILGELEDAGETYDCFAILRPTSPFRKPETIVRAWTQFCEVGTADSLRAVEKVEQHPGKMWVVRGKLMYPLLPLNTDKQPWHSQQYASLPEVYVQNASLEIAWTRVTKETGTISGETILPFFTIDDEGLDINREHDWHHAEYLLRNGEARLPVVGREAFKMPEPVSR